MKFNQWTLGLAAVGAVSMASAVRADEAKLSQLNTAVANTVISGYVDVAAQYNPGNPSTVTTAGLLGGKVDSINVNNVTISLDKALDESPWASGYHVDLNWGIDAIAGAAGTPLRQGYVTVRTPVGNGIDWKVGLFDGVTGYEGNTGYSNPNYTRSLAYQINPASAAGVLGSYKVMDGVSVQAGIANRGTTFAGAPAGPLSTGNQVGAFQSSTGLSSKDYIAAISLTAPESWGWLKGSTLNAGTFQGFDNGAVNNYSVNATLSTPVTGLKFGVAWDAVQSLTAYPVGYGGPNVGKNLSVDGNIYGVYATYQATEKLSLNLRGEYVDSTDDYYLKQGRGNGKGEELTATVQYDLWANVVSRVEFRWDHAEAGKQFGATGGNENAYLVALNLVYKF